MTVSFLYRLLVLAAATFFLVHLAAALLVNLFTPALQRTAERLPPRSGARLLLLGRLAPVAVSLLFVMAICIPGYLLFEPRDISEQPGVICWCASLAGIGVWGLSMIRTHRALIASRRWTADCIRTGRRNSVPGYPEPIWCIQSDSPILALTGILRPQVVVSYPVVAALSPAHLDAALRHESAHRARHDNWKRLLLLAAPGMLPGFRGFQTLERAWMRLAEWEADRQAAGKCHHEAVLLAEALVRVARLGPPANLPAVATPFSSNDLDLAVRVERLIEPQLQADRAVAIAPVLVALLTVLALLAIRLPVLVSVHHWLERLMD